MVEIPAQFQQQLFCGSSFTGIIHSVLDINTFVFNNTYANNAITISACGSSIDTVLALKYLDISLTHESDAGCGVNSTLESSPLSKGLYVILLMGQNGATGNVTIELNCMTMAPTSLVEFVIT